MPDSLRGQLLVSSERLGDPNFARTVVLLIAHDHEGAVGLVLNRPLPVTLGSLAKHSTGDSCPREGVVYRGGPCEASILALYNDDASPHGTPVLPGLRCTSDPLLIRHLLSHTTGQVRFFAGYSGWSAGQLESELEERAWLLLPARLEHVFTNPDSVWNLTRTELVLGQPIRPELIPPDPSLN